jgi:DNA-binding transcriptional LysR family regulator
LKPNSPIAYLEAMLDLSNSQIKLSQLRALLAVAEYGNFSEAALRLDLSQSAVSHAIASLEDELGVLLFSRGRQGASPTPVGEQVIDYAGQILQLLEEMVAAAKSEKSLQSGTVRVACMRSVATHILPSAIAQFRRRNPGIAIDILEHFDHLDVEKALRESQADVGFTHLPSSAEFETWEILRDEYVALLPPTTNFQQNQCTWEELFAYPLIVPSANNACFTTLRNHLLSVGIRIDDRIAYQVNEDSTVVSMVLQGLGAAILPRLAAEPIPSAVRICSLPVPLERVIGVAVLANTLLTPAVFTFLDVLRGAATPAVKCAS